MATGNVFGQETLDTPPNVEREVLRTQEVEGEAACTIFSVQAVVGIGTVGCMRVGVDYGRRE